MITLSKIAKLANVSVSTVSKAFSMSKEVNQETRELIFKIAKENHCFKKYYNAKYPKIVIAVISPEFDSIYYAKWLTEIQKYAGKYNCEITVATTNFDRETEKKIIEYYTNYTEVDGIIIINRVSKLDEESEIPIISIGKSSIEKENMAITFDYKTAYEKLFEIFKESKIKKVGFIGDNHTSSKFKLVKNLIEENNLENDDDINGNVENRFEIGGYEGMEKILSSGKIPDAVICAYDSMALGVMRCLKDRNIKVPEQVSIIGMDNIEAGKYTVPTLSSIGFDIPFASKTAVDNLMNILNGKPYIKEAVIKSELHIRESIKKG